MTQDERLVPARPARDLDRTLADLTQSKGYGGRYGGGSPAEINLKEYLFVVLKRKWLIMSLLLIITSLATIQVYREPSVYEGATTIKIEQKTPSILQSGNGGGIVIGQSDPNFWGTQLKLLQNETLARKVVVTLDLQHNAAFFGPQGQSTIFASLKRIFSRDEIVKSGGSPGSGGTPVNEEILKNNDYTQEQLSALEPYADTITANELLEAENQKRNLQAAYEAAKNAPDPFANPEVQKDQRILKLRDKISELKDKETGLLQKYTKEWPEVQQVEAQIAQLEGELKKAPAEVLASMKAKADAAASQLADLQTAYTRESGLTAQQTKNVIELASMRADLASDQQYLNNLLQKSRELNAVSGETGPSVSVSNYSRLPRAPVGPARMKMIVIALILALVAGIGLAFLLDFLDHTIQSVDDVDRYINLPALALIPAVRSERPRLRGAEPAPLVDPNETTALAMVKDVRSPIAESYRHLRTSLLLSSAGTAP